MSGLSDAVQGLPAALLGTAVVSTATLGTTWAARQVGARRLWRLHDYQDVVIVTSLSVSSDTGTYFRPATGLGQVRALATIAPSLMRTGNKTASRHLRFPEQCDGDHLCRDLILLGGPKNNDRTADFLEKLNPEKLPTQSGSRISVPDFGELEGSVVDGDVKYDYGLVIAVPNPFSRERRAILLSGSHTFGVEAAATWWVMKKGSRKRFGSGAYAAVVGCTVRNNHITEPTPIWETRVRRNESLFV